MADVAQVETIAWDPIDFDNYEEGGKSFVSLPPEGKYFGQAPIITDESFGTTREGYLNVNLDPITIVNSPVGNDYKVRFTRISSKKYSNRNASQVMDYLRACGIDAKPNNPEELKQYVKMTSGKTFQFALQWEAYDKATQQATKGQENFPALEGGGRQTWIASEIDPDVKVYANGRVRFFISAVGK